jgi:hypothetical protein
MELFVRSLPTATLGRGARVEFNFNAQPNFGLSSNTTW